MKGKKMAVANKIKTNLVKTAYGMSIGSDPEFMLANKDGEIISAIPVIKQNKYKPIDLGDGFVVYYDNVLLETNVPPASSKSEFIHNLRETISRIANFLGKNYEIMAKPSHSFKKDECKHKDAREAGCEPEFCAYEKMVCIPPHFVNTFRSAGGHIHIGRSDFKSLSKRKTDKNEFLIGFGVKHEIIQAMDLFFGTTMLLIDNSKASQERKSLYGKAGRFRSAEYGAEYRTPSNYWLTSPVYASLAYDCTKMAFNRLKNNDIDFDNLILNPREVIDNDDISGAKALIEEYFDKDVKQALIKAISHKAKTPYIEWGIR